MRHDNIDQLSVEEIYQLFGDPVLTLVERYDGAPPRPAAPEYTVMNAQNWRWGEDVCDSMLLMCDFGEAFMAEYGPRHELHTPLLLCPPEALFVNASTSTPADIWTLACTIYEVMGCRTLFSDFMPTLDSVLAEQVETIGLPPDGWWDSWKSREKYFHKDGTPNMEKSRDEQKPRALATRVRENGRENDPEWINEDLKSFTELLQGMLVYEPEKRLTMEEVLGSRWMRGYGLPALKARGRETKTGDVNKQGPLNLQLVLYQEPEQVLRASMASDSKCRIHHG